MLANILRNRISVALAIRRTPGPVTAAASAPGLAARQISSSAVVFKYGDYDGGNESYRTGGSFSRGESRDAQRRPYQDRGQQSYGNREDRGGYQPREREPAPPSTNLFVGNIPFGAEEADLKALFGEFGPVSSVRIAYKDGVARGFAHVEFGSQADAVTAYQSHSENPLVLLDRELRVDYAQNQSQSNPPHHTLYFFSFKGEEQSLHNALTDWQESLIRVHFLRQKDSGTNTGAGFIEFSNIAAASEALKSLNQTQLNDGTVLNLSFARAKNNEFSGGGNRGSSGRGY